MAVQTCGGLDPHARSRPWQLVNQQPDDTAGLVGSAGVTVPPCRGAVQPAPERTRMVNASTEMTRMFFIGPHQETGTFEIFMESSVLQNLKHYHDGVPEERMKTGGSVLLYFAILFRYAYQRGKSG